MRPGKYDRKLEFLIQGAELRELKELDLPESFGLDRRIEHYQGKRPLGLYRWDDLDGLLAALSLELDRPDDYYSRRANKRAIKKLLDRLKAEYDSAYGKKEMGGSQARAGLKPARRQEMPKAMSP